MSKHIHKLCLHGCWSIQLHYTLGNIKSVKLHCSEQFATLSIMCVYVGYIFIYTVGPYLCMYLCMYVYACVYTFYSKVVLNQDIHHLHRMPSIGGRCNKNDRLFNLSFVIAKASLDVLHNFPIFKWSPGQCKPLVFVCLCLSLFACLPT